MLWSGMMSHTFLLLSLLIIYRKIDNLHLLSIGQKSKLGNKRPSVGRKVSKIVDKLNAAESEPYNQPRVQPWVVKGYIN